VKQTETAAARFVELFLVLAGMRLVNDPRRVGMGADVAQDSIGGTGAIDAGERRIEPGGILGMPDARVVPVEDRVRINVQHAHRRRVPSLWYNSRPLKRILHGVAIAVLTIGLLAFFLWKSNPRVVWRIIESASVPWLVTALIVNLCALVFRTLRWRMILDPDHPPAFYPTFFANAIGYMASSIIRIPAEFVRAVLLSRRTSFRTAGALGTALTERVLDLFSLLILFVYFVGVHWNDWRNEKSFVIIKSAAIVALSGLAVLTAFIISLYFFSGSVRRLHEWLGRILPVRFRSPWMHFFDTFIETLSLMKRPVAFIKVILFTAGVWLCLCAPFWLVTIAMHHRLPFDSSYFVNAITTVGLAVPTPGGVGGFHKACQLVLTTFYDFDVDSSVAVAIVFHLVGTIPVLVIGLVLFIREGMHWRDVREIKATEE
jgi:uncharacterized protein (TIRG00374 family)